MNPQPLSCDAIAKLTPKRLFAYFGKYARYDGTSPDKPYSIRFGVSIFSQWLEFR